MQRVLLLLLLSCTALPGAVWAQSEPADPDAALRRQVEIWIGERKLAQAESLLVERLSRYPADTPPNREQSLFLFELGNVYEEAGKAFPALEAYEKSLAIDLQLGDPADIALMHQRIGGVLVDLGQYRRALDQFFRSVAMAESIPDSTLISYAFNGIGIVHEYLNDMDRARFYYSRSMAIDSARGDAYGMAIGYMNIGNITPDSSTSLPMYRRALSYAVSIDDRTFQAEVHNSMASVYQRYGLFNRAQTEYRRALDLIGEGRDLVNETQFTLDLVDLYNTTRRFEDASIWGRYALGLAESIPAPDQMRRAYELLSLSEERLGRTADALRYLRLANIMRDSLISDGRIREVTALELQTLHEREQDEVRARIEQQRKADRILLVAGTSLLVILLMATIITYRQYRKTRNLLDALNQSERSRASLFSIVAHDLKNPLTGIIGLSSILAEDHKELAPEEVGFFAERLNQSAQNLHKLMDSLLEWSSLELGVDRFRPEVLTPHQSVNNVIGLLSDIAKSKDVELVNKIPTNIQIVWDPFLFDSIVRNLVSNGIKYSYRGQAVDIGYDLEDEHHLITVEDRGKGMDAGTVEAIFQRKRAHSTPGTEHEMGSGLGLLLSRQLAERYGASLEVNTRPDEGTTVILRIPYEVEKPA